MEFTGAVYLALRTNNTDPWRRLMLKKEHVWAQSGPQQMHAVVEENQLVRVIYS